MVDFFGRLQRRADDPASHFSNEFMRASFQQGKRLVVKGEYAMGACDLTTAPCAYITILRDPIVRLVSFYKYICLQGSENFGDWPPEWDRADPLGRGA